VSPRLGCAVAQHPSAEVFKVFTYCPSHIYIIKGKEEGEENGHRLDDRAVCVDCRCIVYFYCATGLLDVKALCPSTCSLQCEAYRKSEHLPW